MVPNAPARRAGPARTLRRRLRRWAGRTFLRVYGFRVRGGAPEVAKAVVVAYPHTSNWDFPFTLAVAAALDIDIRWLGKRSLFKPPFGWLMHKLGGIPVDRSKSTKMVDSITASLTSVEEGLVVIPPEGTRGKAGRWKTGFYWVAMGAKVPIVLGFMDYGRKEGGLGEVLHPSGDLHADLEHIREFYEGMTGKRPDKQGPITFVD